MATAENFVGRNYGPTKYVVGLEKVRGSPQRRRTIILGTTMRQRLPNWRGDCATNVHCDPLVQAG